MQWQMVSNDWGGVILFSVKSSRSRSLHNIFNSDFWKVITNSYSHLQLLEIGDSKLLSSCCFISWCRELQIIFLFITTFTCRKTWVSQDKVLPVASIFQVLLFALFQTMSKLTAKSLKYSSGRTFISIMDNIRVENYILYSTDGTHINSWQYENCRFRKLVTFWT